jgi:hypothetical protein
LIITWRISLEMHAQAHVKCLLSLSHLNEPRNAATNCRGTAEYEILWKSI